MTTKQISKLQDRISTLKASHRIVWIEGINADTIKGKIAGKPCYFVKAESLNADGGSWYYIVRWESVSWRCTCEATKPCKHEKAIKALTLAQYQAKFQAKMEAQERKQQEAEAMFRKLAEANAPKMNDTEANDYFLSLGRAEDARKAERLSREAYNDLFDPNGIDSRMYA